MGWIDDVAEAVQESSRNIVCGIYKKSPLKTLVDLAGAADFAPTQAYKDAWDNACGAPDAEPAATFGNALGMYYVQAENASGGLTGQAGPYGGPLSAPAPTGEYNSPFPYYARWRWNYRLAQPNEAIAEANFSGYYDAGGGHYSIVRVIDAGTGQAAPSGGGGYPDLTDQQKADLAQVLKQLAAIRNTQGYQNGLLGAIDAKADGIVDGVDNANGKIDDANGKLDALTAILNDILSRVKEIEKDAQKTVEVLGSGDGTNCQGAAWSSITRGIQATSDEVCKVLAAIGLQNGAYQINDGSLQTIQSIADGLDKIFVRLDLGTITPVNIADASVTLSKLTDYFQDIRSRIGYSTTSKGISIPGQPDKKINNVQQAIQELATFSGDSSLLIQGYEKAVIDRPTLHIVMNGTGGLAPQGYFSIPDPKNGLTKAQIKLAITAQVKGDYYCQLELANRRQVSGWFPSEALGLEYLTRVATLSTQAVKQGGFSATHRAGNGPVSWAATPLVPVKASLYAASANGQPYNVLYLQQSGD